MGFIRLFKVRGHFCQKLVGGNAYIDSKAKLPVYPFPYAIGSLCRSAKKMNGFCHIEKGLVNAEFLNVRGVFLKKLYQFFGVFQVKVKAGRNNGQLWTFFQS